MCPLSVSGAGHPQDHGGGQLLLPAGPRPERGGKPEENSCRRAVPGALRCAFRPSLRSTNPSGGCTKRPPPGTSCLLPPWAGCCWNDQECWGFSSSAAFVAGGMGMLRGWRGWGMLVRREAAHVPQLCIGLAGPQPRVGHGESSGS